MYVRLEVQMRWNTGTRFTCSHLCDWGTATFQLVAHFNQQLSQTLRIKFSGRDTIDAHKEDKGENDNIPGGKQVKISTRKFLINMIDMIDGLGVHAHSNRT